MIKKGLIVSSMLTTLLFANQIEGNLIDIKTKKPIVGAEIYCNKKEVKSDTNGSFFVPNDCKEAIVRACGYKTKKIEPKDKTTIELIPFAPKALYFSTNGITHKGLREQAYEALDKGLINALVIDVKNDKGELLFKIDNEIAQKIGANNKILVKDIKSFLEPFKQKGVYLIARVAIFKDPLFANFYSDKAVKRADGSLFLDEQKIAWADAFDTLAREYNKKIAIAAAEAGFDEIQLDYVRFPDKKNIKLQKENIMENRVEAITSFIKEVREALRGYEVAFSADFFGYIAWNQGDTGIGQDIEKLTPLIDYISLMLYPSGFQFGIPNYRDPVKNHYEIIYLSLLEAQKRTNSPSCKQRPWLQAFKDYAFDRRQFTITEIQNQIKAAENFGTNGWLLWNPRNVYANFLQSKTEKMAQRSELENRTID